MTSPIDPLADPKVQRHRAELVERAKRGESDARKVRAQELQKLREREPRRDDDALQRQAEAQKKRHSKPAESRDELRQDVMTRAGVHAVLKREGVRPEDKPAVKAALEAEFEEQGRREQEFQEQQVAGQDVSQQPGTDADQQVEERGRSGSRTEREQSGRRQPSRSRSRCRCREDRVKERQDERAKHWEQQADLDLSRNIEGLELL